ncbi:hypothetical protein TUM4438_43840 [Shewanella sairae]|uniref:Uncharacterized protein n=1 Tax=Shewanella sairae TaxID=190310 RepID=A0ABQ4PRK7_9GAMM|nr:hypothetical protein [Shewanella sairae]MCL1132467.1 hypothetical protein [Shewanella sairae]GIU52076.1 hypothetical protein TUM4438_43840 [Shewanella sairae]
MTQLNSFKLHFSCERLKALREMIDSNRYRYKQAKINRLEMEAAELEFMVSPTATDLFLKNCPDPFFDMGISVVSKEALPYRDDEYHSYSNPRYCTSEQNDEVIDQLKKTACPELEALLEWMIKHEDDGWIIVGVFDLEIAGIPITGKGLCLSFSEYIFARQDNDPTYIPREEGKAAFDDDKLDTDNPYVTSTVSFDAWLEGWQQGRQNKQWRDFHAARLEGESC